MLAVAVALDAQQPGKVFRIGYLDPSSVSGSATLLETFRQELSKLGWIEGKNLAVPSISHVPLWRRYISEERLVF